jgi:hypothetical protein
MTEQFFAFHPHLLPPKGARPFDLFNVHDGPNIIIADTTLLTYIVDKPFHGWLRKIAVAVHDFANAQLQLQINGTPVKFYENINVNLGETALPSDIWVKLEVGSILSLRAINVVAAGAAIRWRLQGWLYSPQYSEY